MLKQTSNAIKEDFMDCFKAQRSASFDDNNGDKP